MIGVLTGDIVNSTQLSSDEYANTIAYLNELMKNSEQKYKAKGNIYRGDEFQIQYPDPISALTSSLLIKLGLHNSPHTSKPILCTLSLAYGEAELYKSKPNTSSGPVYINSGRNLEKTPRGEFSLQIEEKSSDLQLLTNFLNHQLNRLTKTQAQLLYQYIESGFAEHKTLAQITKTSRQNISNRLNGIGAHLVRDYITAINQHVNKHIK